MARFLVELTAEKRVECVVEAPTQEAAERFMEGEKVARFRNWFLEEYDYEFGWHMQEGTGDPIDVRVDEQGEEL